ncbi:MAG: hypothetical protein R3250_10820, partial [Melioribacteraceae bacterium]|nr:hypothetical protein [Melioribacteraceae bacterium]
MTKILCIESSTDICSVSITDEDASKVALFQSTGMYSHAEELTVLVDKCMRESGLQYKELNA